MRGKSQDIRAEELGFKIEGGLGLIVIQGLGFGVQGFRALGFRFYVLDIRVVVSGIRV